MKEYNLSTCMLKLEEIGKNERKIALLESEKEEYLPDIENHRKDGRFYSGDQSIKIAEEMQSEINKLIEKSNIKIKDVNDNCNFNELKEKIIKKDEEMEYQADHCNEGLYKTTHKFLKLSQLNPKEIDENICIGMGSYLYRDSKKDSKDRKIGRGIRDDILHHWAWKNRYNL